MIGIFSVVLALYARGDCHRLPRRCQVIIAGILESVLSYVGMSFFIWECFYRYDEAEDLEMNDLF